MTSIVGKCDQALWKSITNKPDHGAPSDSATTSIHGTRSISAAYARSRRRDPKKAEGKLETLLNKFVWGRPRRWSSGIESAETGWAARSKRASCKQAVLPLWRRDTTPGSSYLEMQLGSSTLTKIDPTAKEVCVVLKPIAGHSVIYADVIPTNCCQTPWITDENLDFADVLSLISNWTHACVTKIKQH